jgi:meso-butanediol dehydrogenase / (S,S)-butanediol dehydrogenase / diacetyl reductase
VAVVTGGGSGIGASVARRFAERGVAVALVGRMPEKLEAVAGEISAIGGIAHPVAADLAEPSAPAAVITETLDALGRIDVIVNNAGTASVTALEQVTVEQFDREFAVNVRAALLLVQAALPALQRSDSASVVNVSSAAAWIFRPGQAVYGGSKAALEYMTRSLAAELAPDRIRVNCVVPGPVDTPILRQIADDVEAAKAHLVRMTPLGRMGTPDEVAWWIVQLTELQASWVTGAVLHVDGGRTLSPPRGE